MTKNLILGSIWLKFRHPKLFLWLDIVASHHRMQFKGNLLGKIWENDKKTNFWSDFGSFDLNVRPKNLFRGFYFHQMLNIVASYHCMQFQKKLMIQTQENGKKNSFWASFRPLAPKFGSRNFFLKNLASSITRYHGRLSSCKISEKTNDPILRKLSEGRTDRREWFHRTLSD